MSMLCTCSRDRGSLFVWSRVNFAFSRSAPEKCWQGLDASGLILGRTWAGAEESLSRPTPTENDELSCQGRLQRLHAARNQTVVPGRLQRLVGGCPVRSSFPFDDKREVRLVFILRARNKDRDVPAGTASH